MAMTKLGHVFSSTMEYPMAMFAGDLAAANDWAGDAGVTLDPKYRNNTAVLKLATLRALLFDVGGTAHVAFGFRDGDAIVLVEDATDEPDVGPAVIKRLTAVAEDPGELTSLREIDVPSGVLVIGGAWWDFDGDALGGGEPPSGAEAMSLGDEALAVRVTPGVYAITRRKLAKGTPGVIRIQPA